MGSVKPSNDPITIGQVEFLAQQKLPSQVYDYYASGADDQRVKDSNTADFDDLYILPRVLRDVSCVDSSVNILGHKYPLPIGIAPSAMQRLASPGGENDVAQAASLMGLNLTLSSNSTTSLEDVITTLHETNEPKSGPQFWFQIYLPLNLELSIPLIRRAEDAHTKQQYDEGLREAEGKANNASLTWDSTIKFLRQTTNMKIILKGIMAPEDAELAIKHGVDAIIVSNHGGRQLDCVPSTIKALPDIAAAVKRKVPVIFDGGIRHGSDVFKALALGADFVLVGRPILWGLAFNGTEGVQTVMNILERELSRTMALAGTAKIQDIDASFLRRSVEGRLSKI
ncbi:S-2-hydroxy-acid oxidase [Penicillium malachiteum]|nr:S-2-hydroxy-acid oxidase [Penicillium malachiteum]